MTNTPCYHLDVESPMNITKQKQTHRYREQTTGFQQGEGWGWGRAEAKTSVEEKETNESDSKITLYSTENNNFKRSTSSVLYTCN